MNKGDVGIVICFSKKYGNKGRAFKYLQSKSYVKMSAGQRLMLHPYITTSNTIVNVLLS